MNARNRQYFIYALLFFAVIFAAFNFLGGDNEKTPASETDPDAVDTAATNPKAPIDFAYYDSLPWMADPFFRGQVKTNRIPPLIVSDTGYTLNGILFDEINPTAIIDGQIVRLGDDINNARVIKIDKNQVILKTQNKSNITLSLAKE
jgi:hypothetical protein